MPIWYAYTPGGEVHVITGRTSRKATLIERTGRFSLCAQDEKPPYKYVAVEGSVVAIEQADRERDTRPMAHRYLGVTRGDQYMAQSAENDTSAGAGDVLIRMRPERWLSVDYGK